MSNIVPLTTAIPAHLAARVGQPSALGDNISGGLSTGNNFPRISIKASRFRLVQDGAETVLPDTTLSVIIVGANPQLSKAFYAAAWNPDAEATQPDCFTLDGTRPDPQSTQPQNDLCASCPQNAWGSKVTPTGTKIKACADKKRLAVVAAVDPSGPMYLLEVTAAALKPLNQYHRELASRGIAPEIVQTVISFDTEASFPKLQFGFGGFIDEATQGIVDGLFGTDPVKEITGEASPAAALAPPVPAAGLTAPPVTPVVTPATPEPAAPEPVAAGFGTPAAAPVEAAPAPAGFGAPAAAPVEVAPAAPEPVAQDVEPAAAPVPDAGTAALAGDIADLMASVSDDG